MEAPWRVPSPRPGPRPVGSPVALRKTRPRLRNRYRIARGGVLTCTEAPTLSVRLQRGFTLSGAEARNHPPGAFFLDGVAQAEPFLSPERGLFNLDHHEGCVRAFTYATCEQAMVVLKKGVDLRRRDWVVYANDADLDTVLAIWVLLNHLRLVHESPEVCARIMPLLRLEGCIDAHGLGLEDLCALSPDALASARQQMKQLRQREVELIAVGRWQKVHLAAYVAERLQAIDRLIYEAALFDGLPEIEELARTEIGNGSVAVVCRSEVGVYEAETELKRIHGDRLALFALQKSDRTYTLRQVDSSLPTRLETLYDHLNLVDPGSGGHLSTNRWGGSDEIGGSPREAGSRMSPEELAEACRRAHGRPGLRTRLGALLATAAGSATLLGLALAPLAAPDLSSRVLPLPAAVPAALASGVLLTLFAGLLVFAAGRRAPGLFGLRMPAGWHGWALLPFALVGAAAGGVWLPASLQTAGPALPSLPLVAAALAFAAGLELLFRGWVHGHLATRFLIQRPGGRWFLSAPVFFSSLLYAGVLVSAVVAGNVAAGPLNSAPGLVEHPLLAGAGGALLFAMAAGCARERSQSVLVPLALHWAGLVAAALVATLV